MKIINRGKCVYYIKEESIILEYNRQYTSFNVYKLQNRKKFKDFKQTLEDSAPGSYDNINDILGLATSFELIGMAGYRPTLDGTEQIIE